MMRTRHINDAHTVMYASSASRALGFAVALTATGLLAAPASAQAISGGEATPRLFPPPPAGGVNVPNLGIQDLKKTAAQNNGILPSSGVTIPPGTIPAVSPAPSGWVLTSANLYLPDTAQPGVGDQTALTAKYALDNDAQYPLDLWFENSDPSGSLDRTSVDSNGDPVHFNLHWPEDAPEGFWLDEHGIDASDPHDDVTEIVKEIYATGSQARVQEAIDILLGTNDSGALDNKAYLGFELLHYKGRKDNRTFDEVSRNIVIDQLWFGTEIRSSHNMVKVPAHGEYTITWRLRGLGDTGVDREFAFPIDEFSALPMKRTANGLFWNRNAWVWKWFDAVEPLQGSKRKYSLESLFQLHTGTPFDEFGNPVPTYSDLDANDPRYWLHINRKLNLGSFVGGAGDIEDLNGFQQFDLDNNGTIGGFLVDGTDTGAAYDETTNADAQFNVFGVNEYAVPMLDWSQGPYDIPHFGYDSSFTTLRRGQGIDVTVRYGQGQSQAGLYVWGWREHPPRINWLETYSDGQMLPSGAPKDWRFGHKWDEVAELGLDAIGDLVPEKRLYNALVAFGASAATQADIEEFERETITLSPPIREKRMLPQTPGVANFPNPDADLNLFYGNLDVWGDRERISAAGKQTWREGDKIKVTIYNDDNVTRFFRVVDFGTTDYQYNGLDMGRLDWKPVFGVPQIAAQAWASLFTQQGYTPSFWNGTEIDGIGNPFYVDPLFDDPLNYWPQGERDLKYDFDSLAGFSGPGFHFVQDGVFTVWGNNFLAQKPTGDADIWSYSYGKPVPSKQVTTFEVEMPRSAALNNGAMYIFDPQFHYTSIYTLHPESELTPEGLDD